MVRTERVIYISIPIPEFPTQHPFKQMWTEEIAEKIRPYVKKRLESCSVVLRFHLSEKQFGRLETNVDNLAKPILDALKPSGIVADDRDVFNMEVTKFWTLGEEKVQIEIYGWK